MSHFRGVAVVLALVLGSALLTLFIWQPVITASKVSLNPADLPGTVAGYTAAGDDDISPEVRAALPGATILSRVYASSAGPLDFTLVGATSRSGVHDPRLCLTGAGWRLSDEHSERLPDTDITLRVCQAATTMGPPNVLVAYFYVVDGRVISSPTRIRTALLWSALLGRQSAPTYFFRFVLPVGSDPASIRRQHAQLQAFAAQMWLTLRPKISVTPKKIGRRDGEIAGLPSPVATWQEFCLLYRHDQAAFSARALQPKKYSLVGQTESASCNAGYNFRV